MEDLKASIDSNFVPCGLFLDLSNLAYGWRGKFKLTSQDSAGGKNFSVLTSSQQVRKETEIRQLFSLETALNIHEKGFTLSEAKLVGKTWKI